MSSATAAEPAEEWARRDSQGSGARLVLFEARLCGRLREAPQRPQGWHGGGVLTIFGVVALTFMMAMYGLDSPRAHLCLDVRAGGVPFPVRAGP
jgi:hypothetical protein